MFSAPPIDFAETDLGYVGSQNKFLLKIPQGQITIDAKRGQVFLIGGIGGQIQDLSAFGSGLNKFFTDHLAFEILRYYPNADTDNHFNACGLHGVYDSKYDRIIISKLDYIPQPEYVGVIQYDEVTGEYYINKAYGDLFLRKVVKLTDRQYFCNKSWTLSYSVNIQSWISFHSYIPNWYIAENNFFYSGLNEGCDLEAIAVQEIPSPTTTSTTTAAPLNCVLAGTAAYVPPATTTTTTTPTPLDCTLTAGSAVREASPVYDCTLTAGSAILSPCPAPKAYTVTNSGNFYWTDCNGNDRYEYFETGAELCICNNVDLPISLDGGTGTLAGGGCECPPTSF